MAKQPAADGSTENPSAWGRIRTKLTFDLPPTQGNKSIDSLMAGELKHGRGSVESLFGIALSGGGIRSATYCLGLLQALQKHGLLRYADYLSTVSGGGYTGAFWSAWRYRNRTQEVFPGGGEKQERPEILHLRRFSNFLSPRLQLFSYDTGRLVVAPIAGALPALLTALSVVFGILLLWCASAYGIFRGNAAVSHGIVISFLLVFAVAFEAVWHKGDGRIEGNKSNATYIVLTLIAIVVTSAGWAFLNPHIVPLQFPLITPDLLWIGDLIRPVMAWVAAILVLILLRTALSRWLGSAPKTASNDTEKVHGRVRERSAFDRLISRILLLAALWTATSLLWFVGSVLFAAGESSGTGRDISLWSTLVSAFSALFIWARKLISRQPNKAVGGALPAKLRAQVPRFLASSVVVLLILGMVVAIDYLAMHEMLTAAATVALINVMVALVVFHPNRIGMHAFYRSRLARAYMGASNPFLITLPNGDPEEIVVTEERSTDDLELHRLYGKPGPVHLVCCAANNLTPAEPLRSLQRGAVSAVLSPYGFSVGDEWKAWEHQPSPTLGAAITASGAAFNSLMGPYSSRFGLSAIFLMTALNLRLGMWLRHPVHKGAATKEWAFPGRLFIQEMFGICRADGDFVHLSDGGHFDNTAVYELIRRKCRYIIMADCGADPTFAFDDLGNLIRRAREDFKAEIKIDIEPVCKREGGKARQPMVAGDIHYSDGSVGVLLLFKPTLIGTEPADVRQYQSRNQRFPAETTGDQFYDEAQWESYRRLGEFAGDTAFAFMRTMQLAKLNDAEVIPAVFARARAEWLPRPADFVDRIATFAEQAAALDQRLADQEATLPYSHVYREIADLEGSLAHVEAAAEDQRIVASLGVVREAVHFMEETYYRWELETAYNLPLNLGVMNYFARWANADALRSWWPIVKSMYSPQFTRFMEYQFGLKGIQPSYPDGAWEDVVAEVDRKNPRPGFATRSWQNQMPAPELTEADRIVCYYLQMFRGGNRVFRIQAALLRYRIVTTENDRHVITWEAKDFYVPPGLWGIGIGDDFLRRVVNPEDGSDLANVKKFTVRIHRPGISDIAAQKSIGDLVQLYRGAGFRETPQDDPSHILLYRLGR
jgi:hypothetical protein